MKIEKLLKEINDIREPKELTKLINEIRKEIILAIAENSELIERGNVSSLKSLIDEIKLKFETQLKDYLDNYEKRLFWRTIKLIDEILEAQGYRLNLPFVSEEILEVLKEYRADLITKITNEMRDKIRLEIQLGVLGVKSVDEIIKSIGKNLKDKSIFKSILHRAEVIQRTEMNRVYATATFERIKQWGQILGDKLYKMWIHSHLGVPRKSHLLLDRKKIPWNENFKIINRKRGVIEAFGPYDNSLPPDELINCRCIIIPVVE